MCGKVITFARKLKQMHPKLIFSDIDGTLLNTHRELSDYTIEVIKKVRKKVPFLLVSARMPKQMIHLQRQFEADSQPMICYNGALVLADSKIIHTEEIPLEYVEWILDYNEKNQKSIHISLFHNDQWFVERYDAWAKREEDNTKVAPEILSNREALELWRSQGVGLHKITCMGEANLISRMYAALEERFSHCLHLYRSKDTYIEIASLKVSKWTGIKQLIACQYPQVDISQVMVFGDNYNDIEMILKAGYGIAVENARDEVLQASDAVTSSHKEDGVAKYLTQVFDL